MNTWQVAQQLAYLLKQATWPGGATEPVFGTKGVYIATTGPEEAVGRVRVPCAIIQIGDAEVDDEHTEIITQRFDVIVVSVNQGDPMGQGAVVGSHRAGGFGSSRGRGILEFEEIIQSTIWQLHQGHGISIKVVGSSEAEVQEVQGIGFVAVRTYTIEAVVLAKKYYPKAHWLSGSGGGGSVTLSWALPGTRYDQSTPVLRRAAGSIAPATVSDGDGVTIAQGDTSVVDSPGAGTWSYSLFLGYDEDGDGTADSYSDPVQVTVTI